LKFFSLKFHGQLKNFIRLSPIFNKLENQFEIGAKASSGVWLRVLNPTATLTAA